MNHHDAEVAVGHLLSWIGEDPTRDGLLGTPGRVARALREMTVGYQMDPKVILSTVFDAEYDQIVVLRGIEFSALCEHHLLPFTGTVTIGYLPWSKVVGLSKLARLVECRARRLQIQERMTQEIAGDLQEHLNPQGVGVIVRAHHHCMGVRGVKQPKAEMITSAMTGVFRSSAPTRAEFLRLAEG